MFLVSQHLEFILDIILITQLKIFLAIEHISLFPISSAGILVPNFFFPSTFRSHKIPIKMTIVHTLPG